MLAAAGGSAAQGPPPAGGAPPPPPAPTAPAVRPTVAVFNMAAVMRDYGKAKYQVHQLNAKRVELSKALVALRAEYAKLNDEFQKQQVPQLKEDLGRRMVAIGRQIEDEDRKVSKVLNEMATGIISSLYDEIKTVVDKTAEMNGYHIVFAYPDAVTEEEMKSAWAKELKLKPPAAQPFYVANHVNMTGVVVSTLNAWYPAKDEKGQPVDVSKLVDPVPAGPGGGAPSTTTPTPGPGPVPGGPVPGKQ
jgi:Skp family chaperone for outer membrane proteins